MHESLVIQFAKAPIRGKVKTRLEQVLGQAGSLLLHDKLLRHTFKALGGQRRWAYQLWVTAGNQHYFETLLTTSGGYYQQAEIHLQRGDGLGERMANAVHDNISQYDQVILVGSDCPAIDAGYIQTAIEKLKAGCQVVIGPARDGGYGLIGFSALAEQVFKDISWGTAQVMDETRSCMEKLGLSWSELEEISDIDRPEDLSVLASFPGFEAFKVLDGEVISN